MTIDDLQPLYGLLGLFLGIGAMYTALGPRLPGFKSAAFLALPEATRRKRIRRVRRAGIAMMVLVLIVGIGATIVVRRIAAMESEQRTKPPRPAHPSR